VQLTALLGYPADRSARHTARRITGPLTSKNKLWRRISFQNPLYPETERENLREATLEGLNTAARKGNHGGRPTVITNDMLHTVLRRRATGESVESIQPDLIIPTGKRKGQNPSLASIYRALAEHAKTETYPEAIAQAHSDFAALQHSSNTPHHANTDKT
jgi:hypothetical protein